MTPTPRKVRSGRRQFGPGTDQEWEKVMASPHVQRAFSDPAIQQALMQHMAQQAAVNAPPAQAPAPPPPGMAQGGALHFDTGGVAQIQELQTLMQQIATMPEGPQKEQVRMRIATLQAQQSANMSVIPPTAAAGTTSGLSGLSSLSRSMTAPPTMGNTALAAGVGALMGAGNTANPGKGALLGAGLSGALSYLIRKYGKGAQQSGRRPGQSPTGISTNEEPNLTQPAGTSTGTNVPAAEAWNSDWRNKPDTPIQSGSTAQPTESAPSVDLTNLPSRTPDPFMGAGVPDVGGGAAGLVEDEDGLAKGGPAPPSGLGALSPVLHIVIAPKPKLVPKKASLLPPKRGPQDGEDRPRAHGRVQVPRGSGAAIKGKRFGGIF